MRRPRPRLIADYYGAERAEAVLARAIVFFRACGVVEVAFVLAFDWHHYRSPGLVVGLVTVVFAESAVLVGAAWSRGYIRAWWVGADVAFLICGLVASALLTAPADGHSWVFFMYPFTVCSSYSIAVAFHRMTAVVGMSTLLAAGYAASAIVIHHDPVLNAMPNAASYYSTIAIAWAANELRRSGRASDASRSAAISAAEALARERERARHARILHDRVLQTMEALAYNRHVAADSELHTHISAEAAWLRAFVAGTPTDQAGGLLARLGALAVERTTATLRVEFNSLLLHTTTARWEPPPDVTDAVVAAAGEALTNVAKHSGAAVAILRAAVDADTLTVSVLDHGAGFDVGAAPRGIGMTGSIVARVMEAGGSALIDSAPGAGTYVELTVPVSALLPAAGGGGAVR